MTLLGIGLAFFLASAWVTGAVVYPLFDRLAARWPRLARASLLVAALPTLVGLSLALSAFLPGDPHLDQVLGCHCGTSMPGWLHLCPVHPTTAPSVLLPAALALVVFLPGFVRGLIRWAREPVGTGSGAEPTLVDLPRPMAVLAGWLRPSLLVDRRLWASLEADHQRALLAHERAHLARRDPWMLAALRLLGTVAPRTAALGLVRRWLSHAEQQADAGAATEVDRLTLAEALVACARANPPEPALQLGWTAGGVESRVHALLDVPDPGRPARPDVGWVDLGLLTLALGAALSSVPWIHHQVEHLLNVGL